MATHAATRNISGLARALAQHGVMSEAEAEAIQVQSQSSGVPFVEQVLSGKRLSAQQLAVFASRAFGVPLLDLSSFDVDQINKEYFDTRIAQSRRVLPLHKRGNRLYVATSDPANLQALDEVRFKTNLVVEPVVVEDDKLAAAIVKLVEASGASLKEMAALEDIEVTLDSKHSPTTGGSFKYLADQKFFDGTTFHRIVPVQPRDGEETAWDIVGPICESSDVFARDRMLPELRVNDAVALLDTGAYGAVMASNYNSRPLPAEVLVRGDPDHDPVRDWVVRVAPGVAVRDPGRQLLERDVHVDHGA